MTYKIPDCPKCNNQGYTQHLNYASNELFGRTEPLKPAPILTSIEERPCDCYYAQNRAANLAHFSKLSPQEIIEEIQLIAKNKQYLDRNNQSIDKEFEI